MKFLKIKSNYIPQIIAAFSVDLIAMAHGIACGWLSPYLSLLTSEKSPLATGPLNIDQLSWIGALLPFGGMAGSFIIPFLANRIGRRKALLIVALPQISGWFFTYFGKAYYYLYIARFLMGFSGGGMFALIPLYNSEILEAKYLNFY